MSTTPFTDDLLAGIAPAMAVGNEVIALMRWLEGTQDNLFTYTSTKERFLAVMPIAGINAMWSHLAFVIDPDFTKYFLNREDMQNTLVSFLRCGGDGSHIALWRDPEGAIKYVFCGSEGEVFVLANSGLDFIRVLAMGYESIEGRFSLEEHPRVSWEGYNEGDWPEPKTLQDWVRKTFAATVPDQGRDLLPYSATNDPFAVWVQQNNLN